MGLSRGHHGAAHTPHTLRLIIGTEILIGWRREPGHASAREVHGCQARKLQVTRTVHRAVGSQGGEPQLTGKLCKLAE